MTALSGNAIWSRAAPNDQLPAEAPVGADRWPFVNEIGAVTIIGPIYQTSFGPRHRDLHRVLLVPLLLGRSKVRASVWSARSRREPAAVDTAGISVRGLRYSAVVICGLLVGLADVYLALGQPAISSRT